MSLTLGKLVITSPARLSIDEVGNLRFNGVLNNSSIDDVKYLRDELISLASMGAVIPFYTQEIHP